MSASFLSSDGTKARMSLSSEEKASGSGESKLTMPKNLLGFIVLTMHNKILLRYGLCVLTGIYLNECFFAIIHNLLLNSTSSVGVLFNSSRCRKILVYCPHNIPIAPLYIL